MKNTNYLITGGAGAIGSCLVNYLAENENNHIDIIDNLDSGNIKNFNHTKNVNFYKTSILNTSRLEQFKNKNYNFVFHTAACFANQNSIDHPHKDLLVNSEGTLNILELSSSFKNLKRFIYFSSSCVYGSSHNLTMKESDRLLPETPYGISKLAGENYTNFFHSFYKLPTTVLRLFNIYASHERPGKYRNIIPNFVNKALSDDILGIYGDGSATRGFTHVNTFIQLMLNIINDPKTNGGTYNAADGSQVCINDLAELIIKSTNSKSKIEHLEKRCWDNIHHRRANVSKIKKYLPKKIISLSDGIHDAILFAKSLNNY